ncbi:uncharacterized protein CC84DRAFT_1175941 [Paraphaeosphaeria sporulosa]|uniref:Uncharacterized protein n=1 Tax=Paraphaeosphaeria sporulosa TaxID=1460663 RepID=A0A177CET9_9PLEO|nr:uncharacterized protein CC84DRAFT_1175941 [Paraphaeosphaeria sporulosa]OAG05836.1 hypothetical protein CC84DRAFT_1175941 [Paraphaeosphaeria sporulosa]
MATYSHSPRLHAVNPTTPVHSPHHSVHSSSSSRLSVRNLTLHEYRKQQNSPASQATPPGRTLRRKPAASGLKETESAPSVSRTPLPLSRAPPRPLHLSQSTHSLFTYQQLPPSPPHQDDLSADNLFRSQSAGPSAQNIEATKKREFKPIKRLPKPLSTSGRGPLPISPAPLASVTSNQPRLSPLKSTSFPSFEDSTINDDSQPTPLSFSLSRFPQPPNFSNPTPIDEDETPRLNTISFVSTAPVTPPATPAVIHYRGASFDLVNPHSSLVLDNIVTPSRERDSSEYLPLRSSEDPLLSEMAPKRPLYGDLSSAYESIRSGRGDNRPPHLNLDFPLPSTPGAQSPGSSAFDSPAVSPQSYATASPPSNRKPASDSRFSLKNLTRSLTQRFSKVSEKEHGQELQEFSESRASLASPSFEGEFPRPLERSYHVETPKASTVPEGPATPVSPLGQPGHFTNQQSSPASVEQSRYYTQRDFSAPLTSMIPDDPSSQAGRANDVRPCASESDLATRPYYDDFSSIYPGSSTYSSESRRQSKFAQIRASNRESSPFYWGISGNADALAEEYKSDALPQYPASRRTSRRVSKPLDQEMFHGSMHLEREKTDTISKFIDQYKGSDSASASHPLLYGNRPGIIDHQPAPAELYSDAARSKRTNTTGLISGTGQFQFDFNQPGSSNDDKTSVPPVEVGRATFATHPGLPPSVPAPLAPAFQYDEDFESPKLSGPSDSSSQSPSYDDTRVLLEVPSPPIQPASSSYSQPGITSTPPEAMEQAEEVFSDTSGRQQSEAIPAMWSKRVSSHNLLRNKSNCKLDDEEEQQDPEESSELIGYEDEEPTDWETMDYGTPRRGARVSGVSVGESLADYSSSEGSHSSRDSKGFSTTFPVYEDPPLEAGSFQYRHPLPLRNPSNPLTSSPPQLSSTLQLPVGVSLPGMVLGRIVTPMQSSPPASSTLPTVDRRSTNVYGSSPSPKVHASSPNPRQKYLPYKPWTSPYEMSEKVTQELLASGPNDEILYEEEDTHRDGTRSSDDDPCSMQPMRISLPSADTMDVASSDPNTPRDRENSFDKLTVIGRKGNLTGTPHGTGMKDAGSSVADNSSPGAILDSTPLASSTQEHTGYRMFKSTAAQIANSRPDARFGLEINTSSSSLADSERRGNVNRDMPRVHTPPDMYERTPSQATLHQESPFANPERRASRLSLRSPITPRDPRRRGSRAAVPGQTKLRQMVLASSAAKPSSEDRSVHDSRIFGTEHSARPSTSNTHTPLRHAASRPTLRTVLAYEESPHLLCPERAFNPVEEEARRKFSWAIFTIFCILPPALILYRWYGDLVIVNVTKGRFSHVSPEPKRLALGVGIAVNVGITVGILVPILIAHAAGTL